MKIMVYRIKGVDIMFPDDWDIDEILIWCDPKYTRICPYCNKSGIEIKHLNNCKNIKDEYRKNE